jgi:flagellar protein FlaF
MAVAEIIGAAIGVMMLVIVAYMLVGSVLTAAEVVNNAQKDNTLQQEIRLGTSFEIKDKIKTADELNFINVSINNTGREVIRDFSHMDIFAYDNTGSIGYQHLTLDDTCSSTETWCYRVSGNVIPNQLDPDKTMWINSTLSDLSHNSIRIVTSNGVYDSTTIP